MQYRAYYASHHGTFTEIVVDFQPGHFRNRTETPTGRAFRTEKEADVAMIAANAA